MPPSVKVKKLAQLTGHNASIFALSPYKSPHTFLSGAGDGWIVEWDLRAPENGRLIAQVETQVFYLDYLNHHASVIAGNMNGGVHWIPLHEEGKASNIAHHQKGVFGALSIGNRVYTIGGQGMLTRWNADTQRATESVRLSNQSLRSIAFSPARNELAIGSSDHNIYLLDEESLQVSTTIPQAHDNSVFALQYTPDGHSLISGGRDAHLKAWQLGSPPPTCTESLPAHWYTINSIVFHPNGHLIATGSRDKTIKIWDANTLKLLKVLEMQRDGGHINSVNRLLWLPYNNTLVSAGDDRSIILWEVNE
jgi:WD40 repeat protein